MGALTAMDGNDRGERGDGIGGSPVARKLHDFAQCIEPERCS